VGGGGPGWESEEGGKIGDDNDKNWADKGKNVGDSGKMG